MRRALSLILLTLPLIGAAPAEKAAPSPGPSPADAARQRAMDRDESRAQARTAAEEIVRLRQQLVGLGAAESKGEKTVGDRGARLAALNAAEADLSARMGKNQVELTRLLGALELYRRDPPPALLVSPKNATDAVNAAILINAITPGAGAPRQGLRRRGQTASDPSPQRGAGQRRPLHRRKRRGRPAGPRSSS